MIQRGILQFALIMMAGTACAFGKPKELKFFKADNPNIRYTGRVDFSDHLKPRMWAPGVYIEAKFKGAKCDIILDDENYGGHNFNYLEIVIDGKSPYRIQTTGKHNVINVPDGLTATAHTILICKDTESNIGYIDLIGFRCDALLPLPVKRQRKIEYYGDSITSGAGMDQSVIPCEAGQWFDEHNAYMTYGAQTSRNIDAQWQLTSLAGIGLVHNCCDLKYTMPVIFDKVSFRNDSIAWDFQKYQPDVITICLGQNDGVIDSALYCGTYVKFIQTLRQRCPDADIVCLSSPMADARLTAVLKRYLTGITRFMNTNGDKKVSKFFFSKQYHKGCGGHPDMDEHGQIAGELTAYLKQLKNW